MNDTDQLRQKRPLVVTILCVLGFTGVVLVIPQAFSSTTREIGAWYPPYLTFAALVGLVCNIGFWKMKKWGLYGYVTFAALNQLVMLSTGTWLPMALIAPAIVIVILAVYFKQMS